VCGALLKPHAAKTAMRSDIVCVIVGGCRIEAKVGNRTLDVFAIKTAVISRETPAV
jgi:hypothetical protein